MMPSNYLQIIPKSLFVCSTYLPVNKGKMLRQACLVLLVYSIGRSESSSILERWVSASLNYEVLKAGSITRVNRPARTMGKCLMWATLLGSEGNTGSASLACYEEGTCTIWPIQAMAVIIKDPSIEDPVCKAIERNLGYTFYGHTFYLK